MTELAQNDFMHMAIAGYSFIAQREREYVDVKPLKNSSSKQILIYKQSGVCFSFTCCEKQNQRT